VRLSRRGRQIVRWLLVIIAILPSIGFFRVAIATHLNPPFSFVDANTYLAAGERLNAGHDLYTLSPGDRSILLVPGVSTAALLSPPPIAAIWRPIAAVSWGYQLWVVACWAALLGTIAYLVLRTGAIAVLVAVALSVGIGQQLAVANVASFFPGLLILSWKCRSSPWIGTAIGAMGAIKLAPFVVAGWLIGERRWRALLVAMATGVGLFIVGAVGAGLGSYVDYLKVAQDAGSSPDSLSRLTGISWFSQATLVAGFLLSIVLGRYPRLSFSIAVTASTIGTPALYFASLVPLLALMAPMLDGRGSAMALGPATGRRAYDRSVAAAP
jgi:Glycosyltransferase family 87